MERNPFRIQTSEQSSTQDEFLSLFGPDVLNALPESGLWDRLLVLEAAPGAGKSTILRLFTPEVLQEIHRNRERPENHPLVRHLVRLGALSTAGPVVLGTLVSCRGQYAAIDDLPIEQAKKLRWFFGLLDARVTLLTLRSACMLADLAYPDDLARIIFQPTSVAEASHGAPEDGPTLYREAARREEDFTSAVDSLTNRAVDDRSLRINLSFLRLLSSSRLLVDGQPLTTVGLTMFDDVQDLAPWQQQVLVKDLENRDIRTGRWIARRLDVLRIEELLPSGGTEGRDYQWRRLEDWARGNRTGFEKLLVDIAARRVRRTGLGVSNFASVLDEQLRTRAELAKAQAAARSEREAVLEAHGDEITYSDWVSATKEEDRNGDADFDEAVRWRAMEILTNRRRSRKVQRALNRSRPASELLDARGADVMTAAELFVALAHGIPFYYGIERLAGLASANIEQFLRIGGAVFDKLVLLQVTGRRTSLTATEQDSIARSLAKAAIEALPRDVPFGRDVQRLVQSIGTYAREETARASAPYAPGVLGVGLKTSEFNMLLDPSKVQERSELGRLSETLRSAIAHDVLEPQGPRRVKGNDWMVFYVNRLLSPAFDLPVTSSHFREIPMGDMLFWVAHGYRPPTRQGRLMT